MASWFRGPVFVIACGAVLALALPSCGVPPPETRDGVAGGRVLLAPGTGLAGARVVVDQLYLDDGKADTRKRVGETTTDEQGYFEGLPTSTVNGLLVIDVSGGTFTDPGSGARIQLDSSTHLKALHWLGLFEDRRDMYVTPVHGIVEARFRYKMPLLKDTTRAVNDAYEHVGRHFGNLDWETVIPADLGTVTSSPTDEVRAAFVLGGLAFLAEDMRNRSESSAQVVNLMTLVDAVQKDVGDQLLDGNDMNERSIGLQVGECPPEPSDCGQLATECELGTCRPLCDLFVNTYRSTLAGEISKFVGTPTWNQTGLGPKDTRTLTESVARNADPDLFAPDACIETADRVAPSIGWEAPTLADGAFVKGAFVVRISATDDTGVPTARFRVFDDTDGDITNSVAVAVIDTQRVMNGVDGSLTITAEATDLANNLGVATRTFQVDNTPPVVTLDSTGIVVDAANVWWSGTDAPTLRGTVSDAHPGRVEVVVGGAVVGTATVSGETWTASLPAGSLTATGNDVTIRAVDLAGNTGVKIQTVRFDATPPSIAVGTSNVFDESNSSFQFVDDATGSFAVHAVGGAPVDLSTPGCPLVHKYVHLLSQPGPGGAHSVLGSRGSLNALTLGLTVSDDGVGIRPGSAEYRVGVPSGAAVAFTPWTAMPPGQVNGPNSTFYSLPFYRDGANGIPALGTTNGKYHVELRATDQFGRVSTDARCWTLNILGAPLKPSGPPSGEIASGFPEALFSTKLNPLAGESGDFTAKFLNADAAGAALWRWRAKNYLGVPIYVTVKISQNVRANVFRQFAVRNTLINAVPASTPCGTQPCPIGRPIEEYRSGLVLTQQNGLKFRARLFQAGAPAEFQPLTSDDTTQTYVFEIPPRNNVSFPEYTFLTYLRSTLPIGQGTDVAMAPSDASNPDTDPVRYTEFSVLGVTLTGKLLGPPGTSQICIEEDNDSGTFTCKRKAVRQRYRALTKVQYQLLDRLETTISVGATPTIQHSGTFDGILMPPAGLLATDEVLLP